MQVFERPADTYVAGFIGAPSMNLLPGALSHDGTAAELEVGIRVPFTDGKRGGADGRRLTIGIRPEHVRLDPQGLELQIDLIEPLGSETVAIGRLPNGEMLSVKLPGAAPTGETMRVAIPAGQLHVFDAETGLRLDAEPARHSAGTTVS
jgi:ABC-type sugar transport system ATPase subunit